MTPELHGRIHAAKTKMRTAVIEYRDLMLSRDANCGANLMAAINPDIARLAKRINECAAELKQIDPGFPKEWIPYPEGN